MRTALPSLRFTLLALVLVAGGSMATLAHGDDPPATATFTTVDGVNHFSLLSGSGSGSSAQIVTGGTVTFTNDSTETHDVDVSATQGGVSCHQTVGGTSSTALVFPDSPSTGSWAGTCTFTKAGTYSFMCDVHRGMTGTVVVTDAGAAPPTPPVVTVPVTTPVTTLPVTTIPITTPVTTIPATGTPTVPAAPSVAAAATQTPAAATKVLAIRLGAAQRGTRVRGTIGGARPDGVVQVALTARRSDLGLIGHAATAIAIGTLHVHATAGGSLTFAVPLAVRGRAALARRGRLAVLVRVTVATGAKPAIRTYRIVLRPAS
jgi:hypothetical protein